MLSNKFCYKPLCSWRSFIATWKSFECFPWGKRILNLSVEVISLRSPSSLCALMLCLLGHTGLLLCRNSYLRAYYVTLFGERQPAVSSFPWLFLIGAHDELAWENLFGTAVSICLLIHSDYWWRSCKIQLNRMARNLILYVKSYKILWKMPRTRFVEFFFVLFFFILPGGRSIWKWLAC